MSIKHVVGKKKNEGETLYVKDATFMWASVLDVKNKLGSDKEDDPKKKRHYEVITIVDSEDYEALEDLKLNKTIFEIGKDKNRYKAIKFPVKDKETGEDTPYTPYKGMYGFSATLIEDSNKGNKNELVVVDEDGEPITELVGNGSKGHLKFWGYRSEEGLLNIQMKMMVVTELVPYEGGGDIVDDELGITVKRQPKKESVVDEFEDDDIPDFGDEDDSNDY